MRLFLLISQFILLSLAAFWLIQDPGMLTLEWHGYHVETSFALALLLLITTLVIIVFAGRLLKSVLTLPLILRQRLNIHNKQKGMNALYHALSDLEQNYNTGIHRHLNEMRQTLNQPQLVWYFEGQMALLNDDHRLAYDRFYLLSQSPKTQNLGLIMTLKLALKEQQYAVAWHTFEQLPNDIKLSASMMKQLLSTALVLENFEGAQQLLNTYKNCRDASSVDIREQRSLIAVKRSQYHQQHQNKEAAYIAAQEAYNIAATVDSGLQLVPFLLQQHKESQARDVLYNIWCAEPLWEVWHYCLQLKSNNPYLHTYDLLKQWSTAITPTVQANLILAYSALQANLWGEARDWFERLPETISTPQAMHYQLFKNALWADIESREHNDNESILQNHRRSFSLITPLCHLNDDLKIKEAINTPLMH